MNERIRELAFQAGFVGESMNPIFGTCQETALKNFAELIVKECMTICEDVAERNDPAIACYYEIKRTFRS